MLIQESDGTFTGGPLDVLLILHDVNKDTFHPAFFEEAPMPGPYVEAELVEPVRLRSKMHHTTGAPTLDEAQVLLDELAQKLVVRPGNVWREREPYPWDGQLGIVLLVPNWLRQIVRDTRTA